MQTRHIFLIDSDSSGHRLSVDGDGIGNFTTLGAAEIEATQLARRWAPAANLRFALDFKWTLSESEIRTANMECPSI